MATSASQTRRDTNILLGVTGSVAAVKAPEIAVCLCREFMDIHIKILLTTGARNFWEQSRTYSEYWWTELQKLVERTEKERKKPKIEGEEENSTQEAIVKHSYSLDTDAPPTIQILDSEEEWRSWNELGDPILHIDLRDWADCLVLAPLSAHTLAKVAHGLCDDALSSVARAWDMVHKPMVLAPAMNTFMWEHPLTQQQLETIQQFFVQAAAVQSVAPVTCAIVAPQVKTLACGQEGNGALASVPDIVEAVRKALKLD